MSRGSISRGAAAAPDAWRWRRVHAPLLGLVGLGVVIHIAAWIGGPQADPAAIGAVADVDQARDPAGTAVVQNSGEPAWTQTDARAQSRLAPDFELVGVAAGRFANMAVIAEAGGQQKVYRVGDQISARIVLHAVSRAGATLVFGDERHWLPLKSRRAAENAPPQSIHSLSARGEATAPAKDSDHRIESESARDHRKPRPERPKDMFAFNQNGEFQLASVNVGSPYESMGLRNGDILRSINGKPVESRKQLMALHQQLIEGRHGQVEVLRNGQLEALPYGGN
ncbi:MAG: PDZ domain-containing protein [Betaproteobacteria bacterium]